MRHFHFHAGHARILPPGFVLAACMGLLVIGAVVVLLLLAA